MGSGLPHLPTPQARLAEPCQISPCLGDSGTATATSWTCPPSLQMCWKLWRGTAATAPAPAPLPKPPARTGASLQGLVGKGWAGGSCAGAGLGSRNQ